MQATDVRAPTLEIENARLHACIRDLAALSAMPLVWVGQDTPAVVDQFLHAVATILRLDLAYVRIDESPEGVTIEAMSGTEPEVRREVGSVGRAFAPLLGTDTVATIPHPLQSGELRVKVLPLGTRQQGTLVVGSRRGDFPTDYEATFLGAAVNQLTIWRRASRFVLERNRADANATASERRARRLEEHNRYLREEVGGALAHDGVVGHSGTLATVLAQVDMLAPTQATVLITGESGTGKELIARQIHERSARAGRPFIKLSCTETTFDTDPFHLAEGGTIFVEEVGDLPPDQQLELLRLLQERQYEGVGDGETKQIDVRVIAASNRDLSTEVQAGRFPGDLYRRLGVFPIRLPPLRERKQDIPLLAAHFVALAARKLGVPAPQINERQWEQFLAYDWPGNVRELANVVERAVILSRGGNLRVDLAEHAGNGATTQEATLEQAQRRHILDALHATSWVMGGPSGAARRLGIPRTTLIYKMQKLGISRADR